MGIEDNKALARAAIGIWNTGHFSRVSDIFAPSYVMHQRHHADAAGDLGIKALEDFTR